VFDQITPTQLADWILEAQLNVRMQVQMHKLLWGDEKGK
jgi:7-carboxy-7-deazaguanine synthase